MSSQKYKLGLIGAGRWGKNFIKTINMMEDVELGCLYTSDPANAKLSKHKPKVYSDYNKMIEVENMDGFIIATPPDTHFQIMDTCINNLRAFIIEKPICPSFEETLEICGRIMHSRVSCVVDYTQLFNPSYRELCNRLNKQKLISFKSQVRSNGPHRNNVSMLWDWLPHDLSMIYNLTHEDPEEVRAKFANDDLNFPNSGRLDVELRFKGMEAAISIDNLSGSKYRAFSVEGKNSTVTMMDNEAFEVRQGSIYPLTVSKETALENLITEFIISLEACECKHLDITTAIARTIERCEYSLAHKGKWVNFM